MPEHSQHIEKLAVLFADICGSTAMYDNLGDDLARRLIANCIATMMGEMPAHHGKLIKTIGDEIMCTFPDAEAALQAACAMQQAVVNGNSGAEHPMHIRIGFHYGDVICESGDIFGDTVNVAARVAAVTRASQIMATQTAIDALTPDSRDKARQVMRAEFKGKQAQYDVFMILWNTDDMDSTRIGTTAFRERELPGGSDELTLRFHGQQFKVYKTQRSAVLGREEKNCQIIVQNEFASRQHVRIEFRFGKFFVVDQSTNGTYIRSSDGKVTSLLRQEMLLEVSGSISLGQSYALHVVDAVEFSIGPPAA
jgi:class 3 adenylate cyclase